MGCCCRSAAATSAHSWQLALVQVTQCVGVCGSKVSCQLWSEEAKKRGRTWWDQGQMVWAGMVASSNGTVSAPTWPCHAHMDTGAYPDVRKHSLEEAFSTAPLHRMHHAFLVWILHLFVVRNKTGQ